MKRTSPMPAPPQKRARDEASTSGAAGGTGSATTGASGGTQQSTMDPDQLSDALMAAGVDLREEEQLLSSSVNARDGAAAQATATPVVNLTELFLDPMALTKAIVGAAAAEKLKYAPSDKHEVLGLLSAATAEWMADVVSRAALASRHRRMSRNDVPSSASKALRQIAQQDKDAEQRREAEKLSLGLGGQADGRSGDAEEIQHRAANDTARMMTSGGKKYSWMSSGGDGGGARPLSGGRGRSTDVTRFREVKEDPGLALRDVLVALEGKHQGASRALLRGYARVRD